MNEYKHKTKNGRLIPISELDDEHLHHIIKKIKRIAKRGMTEYYGGGCTGTAEGMWGTIFLFIGMMLKKE